MNVTVEHVIIAVVALALLYTIVQHRNLLTDLSGIPDRDHSDLKAVKEKHLFGGKDCNKQNKKKINNEPMGTLSLDINNVPDNILISYYLPDNKLYYKKKGNRCNDIIINATAYTQDHAKKVCDQYCEDGGLLSSDSPCTLDNDIVSGYDDDIPQKLKDLFDNPDSPQKIKQELEGGKKYSMYKCKPRGDCKRGSCK